MIIVECTSAGGCGSSTVYDVDFDQRIATEKLRIPWNETAIRGFTSPDAVSASLGDSAVYGTVPADFQILPTE